MTDPIAFDSTTPRFGLPLLFAAQAQKEFFVNEAHALADALLHTAIEGVANTPPTAPVDGECWLVGSAPAGAWSGKAGAIACRQGGNWLFAGPRDGMRVLDRATGQERCHIAGQWRAATVPAAPAGGTTVDAEARAAIAQVIALLRFVGVLPAS